MTQKRVHLACLCGQRIRLHIRKLFSPLVVIELIVLRGRRVMNHSSSSSRVRFRFRYRTGQRGDCRGGTVVFRADDTKAVSCTSNNILNCLESDSFQISGINTRHVRERHAWKVFEIIHMVMKGSTEVTRESLISLTYSKFYRLSHLPPISKKDPFSHPPCSSFPPVSPSA